MKATKFFHLPLAIYVLLASLSVLQAQQAKNVVLADFISTEELYQISSFPYGSGQFPLADLWGWSYNGNEYALVCLAGKSVQTPGSGMALIKVSDPNKIERIKTIKRGSHDPTDNGAFDVRVFNNYAYVCQDNPFNYYVKLDDALSNPTDPFAGVANFQAGTRIHNLHINTTHGLLFLSDIFFDPSILVSNTLLRATSAHPWLFIHFEMLL